MFLCVLHPISFFDLHYVFLSFRFPYVLQSAYILVYINHIFLLVFISFYFIFFSHFSRYKNRPSRLYFLIIKKCIVLFFLFLLFFNLFLISFFSIFCFIPFIIIPTYIRYVIRLQSLNLDTACLSNSDLFISFYKRSYCTFLILLISEFPISFNSRMSQYNSVHQAKNQY